MDNDIREYGNDRHMRWCRQCGEDAYMNNQPFESCPFKNYDEIDEWKDGWLKQQFYHTNHNEQ